jgi:glycosyltransferase involved in cell wall biosynthesis
LKRLLIHAPNVHQGGGKTVLSGLVRGLPADQRGAMLCDARYEGPPAPAGMTVKRFAPTVAGRWAAERHLRSLAEPGDTVLCMGNLPPLYALPSRAFVLLQNRYLCEPLPLDGFGPATRARIAVERLWLRRRLGNVARLIVQTRSMRDSVRRYLGVDPAVLAFAPEPGAPARDGPAARPPAKRFLYPASADPHKNHARLIDAWRLLKADGMEAELHLTVSPGTPVSREADSARTREGLAIVNHGDITAARLAELYSSSDALIYPSLAESFGLPLVEARARGLPIVAAELDYVRDVAEPRETFDAGSSVSIARAVKRFMDAPERPAAVLSPAAFVRRVLDGDL